MDTNVIVRLIVGDDRTQVDRALSLADEHVFFVSLTVLIETEWVLRSRYGYGRRQVVEAIVALTNLVTIRFEEARWVRWALERFAMRGELADYVHMIAGRGVGHFVSFEARLPQRAGTDAPLIVEALV